MRVWPSSRCRECFKWFECEVNTNTFSSVAGEPHAQHGPARCARVGGEAGYAQECLGLRFSRKQVISTNP